MQDISSVVIEADPCPNIDPKAAKFSGLLVNTYHVVADVSVRQRV